ncbi:nuclear transport factor 2 family protein [Winogradskyella sp. DF17]|uniref:Nuclear transport factor 2 family protein n=1 Tax=Winogradskyella pelagia TaxID=2819984 RepID=A0ABS3T019_9FLAO|nr:nuclear transport factor 2 family protein [Winogradskyella sp. DF17]MBO3116084.1 nuclear transport factor 2 family protein [Winogradskyella sp. DF17]
MLQAQPNTEIILFDLETQPKLTLSNFQNISNNEGYDNQPSFLSESRILYASTRNGQTDIAQFFSEYNSKVWINFTEGGEYSPQKIPLQNEVSAVRLDPDGKQALYSYSLSNGGSTPLISDMVVAYYVWVNATTVVSSVIENDQLNLYISNVETGAHKKVAENVGRSIHLVPDTQLVSFISKSDEADWKIKSLDPETGKILLLASTLTGVEDMCWLDKSTMLAGKGSELYMLTLRRDINWKKIDDLTAYGVTEITRLTVNITGTKLALAAELNTNSGSKEEAEAVKDEPKPSDSDDSSFETVVQQQLDAYNRRDIDAFMATYSDDIKLFNYPNELRTDGKTQMRESYIQWFKSAPDLKATLKKRIVIGNKVIDEEEVMANGRTFQAVAIYEVENGLITKVTFIQ